MIGKGNRRFVRSWLILPVYLLSFAWLQTDVARGSQPTPPVTVEIRATPTRDSMTVKVEVFVTAQVKLTDATLEIRVPEGVKADRSKASLKLEPKTPVKIEISLSATRKGQHEIRFDVKARAEGYETAGAREKRYLIVNGKSPARIMTGQSLRRERRARVAEQVKEERRKAPDTGATLDTYLKGKVKELPEEPKPRERKQILAPPSGGIEPYDRVIDRSEEVVRDLDPITVTGRFFYLDLNGSWQPFVNASVDIRDSDKGPDEHLTTTITDWDGRFSATVNNDDGWFQNGRDIYVRVRASNSRFQVQDCSYWPDWTYAWETDTRSNLSDGTTVDYGSLGLADYEEAAILFQHLNQGWSYLTYVGAQDPGFVDLCFPEGSSVYSTYWEEIDIEDGDEAAVDIVLHEYGHATMHNAYGGYWPPSTGGSHGFDDILHENMAFTEGWGTFIALSINDDGVYNSNGWSRSIESFNHLSGHSDGDGEQNEGHVAASMNDVRDSNADGCDPSAPHNAPMPAIWRDSFWGSNSDNIGEYWPDLCVELNSDQRDAALEALECNEIDLSSCACAAVTAASKGDPQADSLLMDLRSLRDRGLRRTPFGERIINLYYRHAAEISGLMIKNQNLRQDGLSLFRQAARSSRVLMKGGKEDILLDSKHADLARRFITQVQELGGEELRRDFETLKPLVDDFEGKRAEEVQAKLEGYGLKK